MNEYKYYVYVYTMRFLSAIKKMNIDTIINKTMSISVRTGTLMGTCGGIHAAYIFSPDKSYNLPYNSMCLLAEVVKDTYLYGVFGLINGLIWPISVPCWIISTIKYEKTP